MKKFYMFSRYIIICFFLLVISNNSKFFYSILYFYIIKSYINPSFKSIYNNYYMYSYSFKLCL